MISIFSIFDKMPDILVMVAAGYLIVSSFQFTVIRKNSGNSSAILQSILCGVVYGRICYEIPISMGYIFDTVVMLGVALVVGYYGGRIFRSHLFSRLCDRLKIHNTPYDSLWDELMEMNPYPMHVAVSFDDCSYEGYVLRFDSHTAQPMIALSAYRMQDGENAYISGEHDVVMLDMSKARMIQIFFEGDEATNPGMKEIRELCEYRDRDDHAGSDDSSN